MSIVHDLRNPLAAIHLGTEMLDGTELPAEQVQRLARNMHRASVRVQELLQDYLEQCRGGVSQLRPFSLRTLIARSVDRIATAAQAQSVTVLQDLRVDGPAKFDRHRIGSVLDNLLVNALEAMPNGGSIHISTAAEINSVVTRVQDTGPGIAPEIHGRLFQPFATARKTNGWGLGLAHSRQAVLELGGEMWLESSHRAGACFAFRLPV